MLPLATARQKVFDICAPLGTTQCALPQALNQILAQTIVSQQNVPPFTASAMDGFAVNSTATAGASKANPTTLEVAGVVETGAKPPAMPSAQVAMRIMTGGAVPAGADCVVPFEDTNEYEPNSDTKRTVAIFTAAQKGQFIRTTGGDTQKGEKVLSQGTRITPAVIGLLASLGIAEVAVYQRPKIAVLSTGNELVESGANLQSGQIYDANIYSISSAIADHNGKVNVARAVKDTPADIEKAFEQTSDSDLIVSTGGVSAGDHDLIQAILRQRGEVIFWKVNLKPGKPTLFGVLNVNGKRIPYIGLTGNPVSALVGFHLFIRPAMRIMQGLTAGELPKIKARLDAPIANSDGREAYFRGKLARQNGILCVSPTQNQFSNALKSMAHANGLIICPSGVVRINTGTIVEVALLDILEHLGGIIE